MLKWCQIQKKLLRTIHSRKAYQKHLSSNVSLSPYSPCDSWCVLCWCGSWFIESLYLAFHRSEGRDLSCALKTKTWQTRLHTTLAEVPEVRSFTKAAVSRLPCKAVNHWALVMLWEFPSEAHFFCTQSSCPERWSQCTEHQINWNARWLWQTSRYLKIS